MSQLTKKQKEVKKEWNSQETKKVQLCEHFLGMRLPMCLFVEDPTQCNFAHSLMELQPPNEGTGRNWNGMWDGGNVDHYFKKEQVFSTGSVERFNAAFWKEFGSNYWELPNWAWGLAWRRGIVERAKIPPQVPRDFDDQKNLERITKWQQRTPENLDQGPMERPYFWIARNRDVLRVASLEPCSGRTRCRVKQASSGQVVGSLST